MQRKFSQDPDTSPRKKKKNVPNMTTWLIFYIFFSFTPDSMSLFQSVTSGTIFTPLLFKTGFQPRNPLIAIISAVILCFYEPVSSTPSLSSYPDPSFAVWSQEVSTRPITRFLFADKYSDLLKEKPIFLARA